MSPIAKTSIRLAGAIVALVSVITLVRAGHTLIAVIAVGAPVLVATVATLGVATVARKLAQLAVVVFVVTVFTFLLVRLLPGEPEDLLLPLREDTEDPVQRAMVAERKAEIREDLGLNESLVQQYWKWVSGFFTGDLGNEYTVSSTRPVSDEVGSALPKSIQLILYSQVLALLVAVPVGVISAYREGGKFDKAANTTAFGALSLPNFAVALLLAYWVGVRLNPYLPDAINIPPQGYAPFPTLGNPFNPWPGLNPFNWVYSSFTDHFFTMLLPALSLALGQIAVYMRLLRSDMIQTLQEDFILMAKSKGISNRRVLWRHALRPSSLTLITVAGLNIGTLIGGAVVIEVIFGIPGMGKLIAESIIGREFITVQSCVAIVAIAFVVINAVLDILYSILDPRIRHVRAS